MYSVNDQQIDYILNDIRRRGVEMEDLQSNLLDHICCIVELNLESDGNFEDFYNKTIPKFFKHELWEIEEETILLLTYKNYYTMKKAMILGGNISLALIAMGTVFRILHWPGGAPILLFGFILLGFMFFPAAIYLNHKSEQKSRPVLNLSILIGGISFIIGILFKVMHWPGSAPLLLFGWSVILGIFLPILLVVKLKEAKTGKEKSIYILGAVSLIIFECATMFKFMHWPGTAPLMVLGSVFLIGFFVPLYTKHKIDENKMNAGQFTYVVILSMNATVLTFLIAINLTGPTLERFVRDESSSSKITSYFEKKNERLQNEKLIDSTASKSPNKKIAIVETSIRLSQLIQEIKIDLIQRVENVDKSAALEYVRNPELIHAMGNWDDVNSTFFNNTDISVLSLQNLKAELNKFRNVVNEVNPTISQGASAVFDTSDKDNNDIMTTWEIRNFKDNFVIGTIARLSEIEKNVKFVESQALCSIK